MKTAEKIMDLSPNIALAILVLIAVGVIALVKNWKKIKAFGEGIIKAKIKNDEYKKMLLNADKKVNDHEKNLSELNQNVGDLKEKICAYDTENHKHWDVSVEYREKYDQQKVRDEEKHSEIIEMQKQLSDTQVQLAEAISVLTKTSSDRESKIDALTIACKELLASEINKKYQRYLILGYIPADEYDEFVGSFRAYRGCNGNSTIESKFNYAMEHLPVQAMESRPVLDVNKVV